MSDNFDSLRPHFDRITEEWWATTQMGYRLWPTISTITYDVIDRALQSLLGSRPDVQVERLDVDYRTYSRDVFTDIILEDKTNRSMAVADFYDCDDFAWRFKADMRWWFNCTAVGFVLDKSSWHAYNIIVFANGKAALFEPQQDRFVALDEPIVIPGGIVLPTVSTGQYSLTRGLILI